ncbi:Bug family tripartite tricarboxylate transporter substrate binding protein [Ottowia thiooxydans]|uniref:Bug family tripartite tricarboxylate transporter substrate binding protein n=1 Tax=Ottowia thiooxydans TaxID=219182 RepID=UPI001FE16DF7|nr:tripartite tricarboxylate transporter substrate binding protein [Ottowia thiooxydans]
METKMKLNPRTFGALLIASCIGVTSTIGAQPMPIRLLVPFAPGGAVDQTARTISNALGEKLGQTIVVENKPGAGGSLAAAELVRAKPDGTTLMLTLDTQAGNHQTIKGLRYDTFKSFDYLNLMVTTPQILVVRQDLPVKNFEGLITYLRSHPGATYGTSGIASAGHVNSAQMALARKLQTTHVPYKGAAPMIVDLLGGHIDFAFAGVSVLLPHINSGKVRAIAVGSSKRSGLLPDIPTLSEFIPGLEYPTWVGLSAPIGMPPEVRNKIIKATQEVLRDPEIVKRFSENAFDVVNSTPELFAARLKKDSDILGELIRQKVISID